jgi:hypothetical protein
MNFLLKLLTQQIIFYESESTLSISIFFRTECLNRKKTIERNLPVVSVYLADRLLMREFDVGNSLFVAITYTWLLFRNP